MKVRVAVGQICTQPGEIAANLDRCLEIIAVAAKQQVHLLVLPELCNTGYALGSRAKAVQLAEPVDGPTVSAWQQAAARHEMYIAAGFVEAADDRCYNSAVIVGPSGLVSLYRKAHLFYRERELFDPGNLPFAVAETEVGRLGLLICYDLRFPEAMRSYVLGGADIICVPTAWVVLAGREADGNGFSMQAYCSMAQASMNGVAVACADAVGPWKGERSFLGGSLIAGPDGWPLAGPASRNAEELLVATVDLEAIRSGRQRNPYNHVLTDRRTDLYRQ